MSEPIPYTKPSITELEIRYATDAAVNGWGSKCYDYIIRFEEAFREHLGVRHAIATSSCTGALHMGLAALGIGPGDEVILADTNWVATAAPITYLGATPVFVDILPDTWCLDPHEVEKTITPNTKAIIATHLYGNLCEMEPLLALGEVHGIPIIEDAAEAIGSIYHGKRAGSMGRFGTFSFHGTKTMTTGEGGMFVTDDFDLFEQVLTLSNHGRSRNQSRQFWPDRIGFKYKMSNIEAAIGLAQVQRIEELIARKQSILAQYRSRLSHCVQITLNPEKEGTSIGAWMPTLVASEESGITQESMIREFRSRAIDARVFFSPLTATPPFSGQPTKPNSLNISQRAINLPSFHDMTAQQQDQVTTTILPLFDE